MKLERKNQDSLFPSQPALYPRRDFLTHTGKSLAVSALAGASIPWVHAGEDNIIRLALIGCGGRGSGAVVNAFESPNGPVQLVAMADLFQDRLDGAYQNLHGKYSKLMDVPADRRFVGFDAYRKAIDCLRPGDVALLTTHAAFRPTHLEYAVTKGVHVFLTAESPAPVRADAQGRYPAPIPGVCMEV